MSVPTRTLAVGDRTNPDVIDQAVDTGMEITGHIYEVPASIFEQGVKTALDLKDALKTHIGLNPAKQNGQPVYVYRWQNNEWQYFMTLQPANEAEWARYVRLSQQQPERYRIVRTRANKARRGAKRNPADEAAEMFEKFHGKASTKETIITEERHEHEHTAEIGPLVECWIETPTGLIAQIRFNENDRPLLTTSEDGTQLFIKGGDQDVNLKALQMDGKDWVKDRMILGRFAEPQGKRKFNISYLCEKDFDDFELIEYQHDLGEPPEGERKRREPPSLEFEPRNQLLYVTGGQYRIKKPVFGTSPGIEN